jgi:hypothetical protein
VLVICDRCSPLQIILEVEEALAEREAALAARERAFTDREAGAPEGGSGGRAEEGRREEVRVLSSEDIEEVPGRFGREIGRGGSSVVFRGVWNRRAVAVKRLEVRLVTDLGYNQSIASTKRCLRAVRRCSVMPGILHKPLQQLYETL